MTNRYSESARRDRQPPITDLIPQRPWLIVAALASALAIVAGLESLYAWMPTLAAQTTDGRIAAFDLDGEGSLAAWFSSATLALAAGIALLVYTIRRHRQDDYHGRYRVWLWAAACWMVMSIDEGGSLHEGFKEFMSHWTGSRVSGDGSLWWAIPYLVVLGYIGIRLLLDMRECRTSSAALIGTAGCYAAGVVIQLGWLLPVAGAQAVMFEEGAEMVGNILLVLAMTLHARFVILDAGGMLTARKKPASSAVSEKAPQTAAADTAAAPPEATPSRRRRTDLQPAEVHAKAVARKAAEAVEDHFDDEPPRRATRKRHRIDEPEADSSKLTKAQRKALRRQKERERREGLR